MPRYYMFVVNEIVFMDKKFSAVDIMAQLLLQGIWACSPNTPHLRRLEEGDRAVVYLAGKGNKCFVSSFKISEAPHKSGMLPSGLKALGPLFPYTMAVEDIEVWERPVKMLDVVQHLAFVTDKKNYGLFLRQGCKQLDEVDYLSITRERQYSGS